MGIQGQVEYGASGIGDAPLLLVAGTDREARRRAAAVAIDSGHRAFEYEALDPAAIAERVESQPAAGLIWVELGDEPRAGAFDRLLDALDRRAEEERFPVRIAAPATLIDLVTARVGSPNADVLIAPSDIERAASMAVAMTGAGRAARVSDVTSEPSSARLRQLSDEVSRIAATLARLSSGPGASAALVEKPVAPVGDVAPLSGDTVRAVIRARRLRSRFFDEELFADPAWDMLLDLLQAEIAQHRVPVSSLCIAAAVPPTTALRWLKTMTDAGLFVRRPDPHDGRRVFIELAPPASEAMRRYFGEVGAAAAI
ncbi:MarR family winged helix-turn-helix transcriptional regulator [Sphingomonas sp. ASV193]|uniref:MarR family winged helix-turn-helix transcriptional regulator n=1 Tax=Sphingomonas sp. ASV193 TaxID=3144405 RepID=UPI0032E8F074